MKKYLLLIFVVFFLQTILSQNTNQMPTILDECFIYLLEGSKESAKRWGNTQWWLNGNRSDTLFIDKATVLDFYFQSNNNPIQDSKIVFTYIYQFAKKRTQDHLYQLRGIELIDNKIAIVFCDYGIIIKRKFLKKKIWRAVSGTTRFYFQYSETNKKWEIVNVKTSGI
jgi:hypothetical protein